MYEADGFHFLEVLQATVDDNGIFAVTVENSAGSDTASAELEVFEKPVLLSRCGPDWQLALHDVLVEEGQEEVELTCATKELTHPSARWFHNEKEVFSGFHMRLHQEAQLATLTIKSIKERDSGQFKCVMTGGNGELVTTCTLTIQPPERMEPPVFVKELHDMEVEEGDKVELDVEVKEVEHPEPPDFVTRPATLTAREGETVTFTCQVKGQPKPSVLWERDGVVIAQSQKYKMTHIQDRHTLTVYDTDGTDAGEYICHLHSTVGSLSDTCGLQLLTLTDRTTAPALGGLKARLSQLAGAQASPPTGWVSSGQREAASASAVMSRVRDHADLDQGRPGTVSARRSPRGGVTPPSSRSPRDSRWNNASPRDRTPPHTARGSHRLNAGTLSVMERTKHFSEQVDPQSQGTGPGLPAAAVVSQAKTSASRPTGGARGSPATHSPPLRSRGPRQLARDHNSHRSPARDASPLSARHSPQRTAKAGAGPPETDFRSVLSKTHRDDSPQAQDRFHSHHNSDPVVDFRSVLKHKEPSHSAQRSNPVTSSEVDFREVLSKSRSKGRVDNQLEMAKVKGGIVGSELRNLHIERSSRNALSRGGEFHSGFNTARAPASSSCPSDGWAYHSGSQTHRDPGWHRSGARVNNLGLRAVAQTLDTLNNSDQPVISARQIKTRKEPSYSPSSASHFEGGPGSAGQASNANDCVLRLDSSHNAADTGSLDNSDKTLASLESSDMSEMSDARTRPGDSTLSSARLDKDHEEVCTDVSPHEPTVTSVVSWSVTSVPASSPTQLTQDTDSGQPVDSSVTRGQSRPRSHTDSVVTNGVDTSARKVSYIEFSPHVPSTHTASSSQSPRVATFFISSSSSPQPSPAQACPAAETPQRVLVTISANGVREDDEDDDVFKDGQGKFRPPVHVTPTGSPRASERVSSLTSFGSNFTWEKPPWEVTAPDTGSEGGTEVSSGAASAGLYGQETHREGVGVSAGTSSVGMAGEGDCGGAGTSRSRQDQASYRPGKSSSLSGTSFSTTEAALTSRTESEADDDFRKVKLKPAAVKMDDSAKLKSSKFMSTSTESIFTDVRLKPVQKPQETFKASKLSSSPANIKAKSKSSDLLSELKFSVPPSKTDSRFARATTATASVQFTIAAATTTSSKRTPASSTHRALHNGVARTATTSGTKHTHPAQTVRGRTAQFGHSVQTDHPRSAVSGRSKGIGAKFEEAIKDTGTSGSHTAVHTDPGHAHNKVSEQTQSSSGGISDRVRQWRAADAAGTEKSGQKTLGAIGKSSSNNSLMSTGSSSNLDKLPDWVKLKAMNKRHSLQIDKAATLPHQLSKSSAQERRERLLEPREDAPKTPRVLKRNTASDDLDVPSRTKDEFHERTRAVGGKQPAGAGVTRDIPPEGRERQVGRKTEVSSLKAADQNEQPEWLNRKPLRNIEEKIKANTGSKSQPSDTRPSWVKPKSPREVKAVSGARQFFQPGDKTCARTAHDQQKLPVTGAVTTTAGWARTAAPGQTVTTSATTTTTTTSVSTLNRSTKPDAHSQEALREDEGFAEEENALDNEWAREVGEDDDLPADVTFSKLSVKADPSTSQSPAVNLATTDPSSNLPLPPPTATSSTAIRASTAKVGFPSPESTAQTQAPSDDRSELCHVTITASESRIDQAAPGTHTTADSAAPTTTGSTSVSSRGVRRADQPQTASAQTATDQPSASTTSTTTSRQHQDQHQPALKSTAVRPAWRKQKSLRHIPIYPIHDNELSPRFEPFRASDDAESTVSTTSISSASSDASILTADSGYPRSRIRLFQAQDSTLASEEHTSVGVSPHDSRENTTESSGKDAELCRETGGDGVEERLECPADDHLSKDLGTETASVSNAEVAADTDPKTDAKNGDRWSSRGKSKQYTDLSVDLTGGTSRKVNGSAFTKVGNKTTKPAAEGSKSTNHFLDKRRLFESKDQNTPRVIGQSARPDLQSRARPEPSGPLATSMTVGRLDNRAAQRDLTSKGQRQPAGQWSVNGSAGHSHLTALRSGHTDRHTDSSQADQEDLTSQAEGVDEIEEHKLEEPVSNENLASSEMNISSLNKIDSRIRTEAGDRDSEGPGDLEGNRGQLLAQRPSDLGIEPHWRSSRSRQRDTRADAVQPSEAVTEEVTQSAGEPAPATTTTTATTATTAAATTSSSSPECPPSFVTPLRNQSVKLGAPAVLRCQLTGTPRPQVKWLLGHTPVQPSQGIQVTYVDGTAQLVVSETFTEHLGEYTCRASNSLGSLSTHCLLALEASNKSEGRAFEGPVSLPPRIVSLTPRVASLTRGSTLTLTVTFVGEPKPEVKWSQRGRELTSDGHARIRTDRETSVLTISSIDHSDAGKMSVCVSSSIGTDQASANICIEDVPGSPVGAPHVYDIGRNTASVSWCSPASSGGTPVTYYIIEAKTRQQKAWDVIVPQCKELSCHIFELKPSTNYKFRVRAVNKHGLGPPSDPTDWVMTSDMFRSPTDYESEDVFSPTLEFRGRDELPFEPREVKINSKGKFEDFYELDKEVGKGKFGVVYKCRQRQDGTLWAAKVVKCREKDKAALRQEIEIMNRLRHPKLLLLWDAFESPRQMVLVMEYVGAGELFERVIGEDFVLTERDCTHFMRQICEGVNYMHNNSILHLDLKPENILCIAENSNRIKIIDFGLARAYSPGESVKVMFGTPEFIAPEVINYDEISFGTDMWSIGVICYVLLSGLSPFLGDSDHETLASVTTGEFDFDDEAFDEISDQAKDFMSKLMVKKKEKRMLTEQCLSHDWLGQDETDGMRYKRLNTDRLKHFMVRRKWLKTGNAVLAVSRLLKSSSLTSFGSLSRSNSNDSNLDSPSPSTTPHNPMLTPPTVREEEGGEPHSLDNNLTDPQAQASDPHSQASDPHSQASDPPLQAVEDAEGNNNFVSRWIERNSESGQFSTPDPPVNGSQPAPALAPGPPAGALAGQSTDNDQWDGNDNVLSTVANPASAQQNDRNQNPDIPSSQTTATTTAATPAQPDQSSSSPPPPPPPPSSSLHTTKQQQATPAIAAASSGDSARPPVFSKCMKQCTACAGDVARFDVVLTGNPPPQVTWYFEDEEIRPDSRHSLDSNRRTNTFSLIIRSIEEDDEGDYVCKATNSQGEVVCSAELSVLEL